MKKLHSLRSPRTYLQIYLAMIEIKCSDKISQKRVPQNVKSLLIWRRRYSHDASASRIWCSIDKISARRNLVLIVSQLNGQIFKARSQSVARITLTEAINGGIAIQTGFSLLEQIDQICVVFFSKVNQTCASVEYGVPYRRSLERFVSVENIFLCHGPPSAVPTNQILSENL